jgi:hypothetical protein
MSSLFGRIGFAVAAAGLCLIMVPAPARAQSFGIGPRFSFLRGDLDPGNRNRYSGGMLRLRTSNKSAVEVSLDYRSYINDSLKTRIKDYPIQASFLFYPVRNTLAPYFIGGIGWYRQRVDPVGGDPLLDSVTTARKTGYHAGLGTDVWMGRHATLHLDYRYTFIGFGREDEGAEAGVIPVPGLRGLQDKLNLSHRGSMWTTGVTVYF